MSQPPERMRADKWLWQARFFKTRSLASRLVSGGHLRVNGQRVSKPAHGIGPGDVLTFAQARTVRLVRVVGLGTRRGPAPEAQALYEDLAPDTPKSPDAARAGPRPTKKDRRKLTAAVRSALD